MRTLFIAVALFFVVAVAGSCSDSDDSEMTTRGGKPTKSGDNGGGGRTQTVWYQDNDGDSYGNPSVSQAVKRQPAGFVADNTDCDDNNPQVNPAAAEECDGVDNNCDGTADNNVVMDSGYMCCGGEVTNINTDVSNCGACGQPCPEGYVCVSGVCEAPMEPCSVAERGSRRCNGTIIEECTGNYWEPVTDCADAGQTCVGTAPGVAVCEDAQNR